MENHCGSHMAGPSSPSEGADPISSSVTQDLPRATGGDSRRGGALCFGWQRDGCVMAGRSKGGLAYAVDGLPDLTNGERALPTAKSAGHRCFAANSGWLAEIDFTLAVLTAEP